MSTAPLYKSCSHFWTRGSTIRALASDLGWGQKTRCWPRRRSLKDKIVGCGLPEDIADAFGSVPHTRLLEALHAHDLDDAVIALIATIIGTMGKSRGLAQGSPLSPLLLNAYLDQKWSQIFSPIPLVRYADDLLLFAQIENAHVARQAQLHLRDLLVPAGMPIKKDGSEQAITDLTSTSSVWLGYELRQRNRVLAAKIAPRAWNHLQVRMSARAGLSGYS